MKRYIQSKNGGFIKGCQPTPADRENRPALKREMNKRLGIYRPVNSLSADRLLSTTTEGIIELTPELEERRLGYQLGELVVKEAMGVTYVRAQDIRKHRLELFVRGFRLKQDADKLQEKLWQPPDKTLPVELDLEHFEWTDHSGRSLSIFFDPTCDGYLRLKEEQEMIADALGSYCPKLAETVKAPNHVTVLKYGQPAEKNLLPPRDKKFIARQIGETLASNKVFAVELDSINAGPSYLEADESWQKSSRRLQQLYA